MTFVVSLLALIVVPQQARKAATAARPPASLRPDTEPTVAALAEAQRQVTAADAALAAARAEIVRIVAATARAGTSDSANQNAQGADARARRDTLSAQAELLGRLIARSQNAPLLGSYRALAQAGPMQNDPRVRAMLDTLVDIERERDSYNAVGGVDPVFVTLTARANELGKSIEGLAEAKRASVVSELAATDPGVFRPNFATSKRPLPDTIATFTTRESARAAAAEVASRLAKERLELTKLDVQEKKADELANVGASPSAILAAALVFGAMLGFGVALSDEVRHPRVANAFEVERATGVRVLGEIRPLPASPERGRRAADRIAPQFLDRGGDGHHLIYLTIATAGTNTLMLTVTGDSPAVSTVVAINFAAIAADEARATLLIDTDGTSSMVSAALPLAESTGVSGLAAGQAEWPEVSRSALLGRDRTIDVVPSGSGVVATGELRALLERDATRLARHYDAIVLVSGLDQVMQGLPTALPIPDVLFCARVGLTPIAELRRSILEIKRSGAQIRGVALWDARDPHLKRQPMAGVTVRAPVAVATA